MPLILLCKFTGTPNVFMQHFYQGIDGWFNFQDIDSQQVITLF
jgi:hypothetical protein